MRNIQKIREQVAAAEQLFGQFFEQHTKYSKRLTHLMTAVEEQIQARQVEVERQRAEIASLNEENGELCDITWTLLQTIKAGNLDLVNEMIRELGLKVSNLVEEDADEGKAPAVEAIAEVADAAVETKVSNVAAEASDGSAEAGACAETDSPSSPAPAQGSLNNIMERLSTLACETEVEPSSAGDEQAAENEAEDVPVAAEDVALDVEVVPAEDRIAAAS
jgi:hypothetical protein